MYYGYLRLNGFVLDQREYYYDWAETVLYFILNLNVTKIRLLKTV